MNYNIIDAGIRPFPWGIRKAVYKLFGMRVGNGTKIARGCIFDNPSNVVFGEHSDVNYKCEFYSGRTGRETITIGNNVWCACNVKFITITHETGGSEKRAGRQIFRPIEVGDGCWIGANATILPGVKIGKGCIIAAGAVVNKNCEPDYLYAGVPARPVKKLPEKPE